MKKIIIIHLFVFIGAILSLSGCELFGDDEHCQYSKDKSGYWATGYDFRFSYHTYQDDFGTDEYHNVTAIYLGANGVMVDLTDVCTGDPIMVSVEIRTKSFHSDFKPYLLVSNKYDDFDFGRRFLRLNPTTLNGTLYRTAPIEVPVWPDFSSEEWAGKTLLTIAISNPPIGAEDEENIQWQCDAFLNDMVQNAKITVSYTYY